MKFAVALTVLTLLNSVLSETERIVCYHGSWATYRQGKGKFTIPDIDPSLCTHYIYTFVGLNDQGKVVLLDAWNDVGDDWHEGTINKLIPRLLANYPNCKFSVAIGGWNEGSEKYSRVVNNDALRKVFVDSIVEFIDTYNLDGFDLDWEYPTDRGGAPSDREAFTKLVKELHDRLAPKGKILSAAVSANALLIPQAYDVAQISKYLTMINVMTYDLHGSWEKVTNHHTALYAHPSDPATERHLNVDAAIKSWLSNGATPDKLNLGLAAYGRTFQLTSSNVNGIGAPSSGPAPAGSFVAEAGFLGYNEICYEINQNLWKVYDSTSQRVPYAVKGNVWVGFDTPASLTEKVDYAKTQNLGGVMIWSIETDDFRGDCNQGKYPLLRAINAAVNGGVPPSRPQEPDTEAPNPEPSTSAPEPSTSAPPVTSAPVEDSDNIDSKCTENGQVIRNKSDCSLYYVCNYKDAYGNLGAVPMRCAPGLAFNIETKACDYANVVKC